MFFKLLQLVIEIPVFELLSNCTEIHGLFDYFEIIRQAKLDGVHRSIKYPRVLMRLQRSEHFQTLGFEALRRKYQTVVERGNVSLDLFNTETVDESVIFLRLGTSVLGRNNLSVLIVDTRSSGDRLSQWLLLRRCRSREHI